MIYDTAELLLMWSQAPLNPFAVAAACGAVVFAGFAVSLWTWSVRSRWRHVLVGPLSFFTERTDREESSNLRWWMVRCFVVAAFCYAVAAGVQLAVPSV